MTGRLSWTTGTELDVEREETTADLQGRIRGFQPAGDLVGVSLTVLSGDSAQRVFYIDASGGTIGRSAKAEVRLSDPAVSRMHARITFGPDGAYIEDLCSVNGTMLEGHPVFAPLRLPDICRIQIGDFTVLQATLLDETSARSVRNLQDEMYTDALTRAGNRRFMRRRLHEEMSFSSRHGMPIGLLMADLDHFKVINDTYGHPCGDRVLAEVARILMDSVRDEDSVYRYGGEEFCVLLRGATEDGLWTVAERIRLAVEYFALPIRGGAIRITVSIGGAILDPDASGSRSTVDLSADDDEGMHGNPLLELADRALYKAKTGGRNRVEIYCGEDGEAPDPPN